MLEGGPGGMSWGFGVFGFGNLALGVCALVQLGTWRLSGSRTRLRLIRFLGLVSCVGGFCLGVGLAV